VTRRTTSTPSPQPSQRPPIVHNLGPLDRCPGCGGSDFLVDEPEGLLVFHCLGCDESWRYELGYVWRVAS
jgi:hypothetical protein